MLREVHLAGVPRAVRRHATKRKRRMGIAGTSFLDLDCEDVEYFAADILDMVWPDRVAPKRRADGGPCRKRPRVHEHVAVHVVADKVAPATYVQRGGPLVRVHGGALARLDPRIEHADLAVFQEDG